MAEKRGRGQSLTKAEKLEKGQQALALSANGVSDPQIAKSLGVNIKTAKKLIHEAIQEAKPESEQEMEILLATAVEHHRTVIETSMSRIRRAGRELADGGFVPMLSPHGLAALLGTSAASMREITRLMGVEPPQRVEVSGQLSIADKAREVGNLPPERRLRLVDDEFTGTDG